MVLGVLERPDNGLLVASCDDRGEELPIFGAVERVEAATCWTCDVLMPIVHRRRRCRGRGFVGLHRQIDSKFGYHHGSQWIGANGARDCTNRRQFVRP
jgi:hypothetical protein